MKKLLLICLIIPTVVMGQKKEVKDIPEAWKPMIADVMVQVRQLSKHPDQSSLDLAEQIIKKTDVIVKEAIQQAQNTTEDNPKERLSMLRELHEKTEQKLLQNTAKIKEDVALHIEAYKAPMSEISQEPTLDQDVLAEKIEEKSEEDSRVAKILSVYFTPTYACRSHGVTAGFVAWIGGSLGASRVTCKSLNGDSITNNTFDLGLGVGVAAQAGYTNQSSCQVGELSEANRSTGWGIAAGLVGGGMVGGSKNSKDRSALAGVSVAAFGTKSFAFNDPKIVRATEQENVDLYVSPDTSIQEKIKSELSKSLIERTECATRMTSIRDGDRLGADLHHEAVIGQVDSSTSGRVTGR